MWPCFNGCARRNEYTRFNTSEFLLSYTCFWKVFVHQAPGKGPQAHLAMTPWMRLSSGKCTARERRESCSGWVVSNTTDKLRKIRTEDWEVAWALWNASIRGPFPWPLLKPDWSGSRRFLDRNSVIHFSTTASMVLEVSETKKSP